jgi:hypothetical protein
MLRSLEGSAGRTLVWSKKRTKQAGSLYELRSGTDVVGVLKPTGRAWASAVGESSEGVWFFSMRGFLKKVVEVRRSMTGIPAATFTFSGLGSGGTLTMADGRVFRWDTKGLFKQRFFWVGPDGIPALYVNHIPSLFGRDRLETTVERPGMTNDELSLFTLLGLYNWHIYQHMFAAAFARVSSN